MALEEMRTYEPVCDNCHAKGQRWSQKTREDAIKNIPERWTWIKESKWRGGIEYAVTKMLLICPDCQRRRQGGYETKDS